MISVPGRVNGGLHEMLTVEESMKVYDKSPTEDRGPTLFREIKYYIIVQSIFS